MKETSTKKTTESGIKKDNKEAHKSDGADTAHSQSSNHSKKSKSSYDKLCIPRSQLSEMKPAGRGEFGEIFTCKYTRESSNGLRDSSIVLVKTLTNTKDESVLQEFKRHIDLLHKLNHENVVKLIGLCRGDEPDIMIIETTDWGDLKQFLLASSGIMTKTNSDKPRAPQLNVNQIISLSTQVCTFFNIKTLTYSG